MDRTKFVVGLILATLLAWPAAADDQPPDVNRCSKVSDQAVASIRAGDMKRARILKPTLEACLPILKAHRDREVDKAVIAMKRELAAAEAAAQKRQVERPVGDVP